MASGRARAMVARYRQHNVQHRCDWFAAEMHSLYSHFTNARCNALNSMRRPQFKILKYALYLNIGLVAGILCKLDSFSKLYFNPSQYS